MRIYCHIDDSDYLIIAEWLTRRRVVDPSVSGLSVREFMHKAIQAMVRAKSLQMKLELETGVVDCNTAHNQAGVMAGEKLD